MLRRVLTLVLLSGLFLPVSSYGQALPNYLPTSGLVAWWPFNGNANDESGNGNNGTVYNSPSLTVDRFGNNNSAYNFDWSNVTGYGNSWQKIELPTIVTSNSYSVNIWMRPTDYCWPNNSIKSAMLIGGSAACSNTSGGLRFGLAGNSGAISSTIGSLTSDTGAVNLDVWQMATLVVKPDSSFIYINSVLVASSALSQSTTLNSCLSVGLHHQGNGHWYYFNGDIDDLGIWDRALTQVEVSALYTNVATSPSCNLLPSNSESICHGDSVTLSLNNSVANPSVLIDTIGQSIGSNWSRVMTTIPGKSYRLRVGGEFTYATYCPSLVDDPAYSKPGFYGLTTATPRSITNLSQGSSTYAQGLYVMGATINRPTPDVYNPTTHNYDYYFTATGSSIEVGWSDSGPGDNCGSAGFALYEVQAAPNILWSTGDTTASISVAPTTSTSYWVTDGSGCYDTVTVAVNNPVIQSSSATVCGIGDSVLLWNSGGTMSNTQNSQPCLLPLNSLNSGLTGWYPFCGDANDASTVGNDGTVQGAVLSTDMYGNANASYSFDGQSSKIALDNPFYSGATNVSNFSIYSRFKIDALPQSQATIFSKEGYWRTIALIITADGEVNLRGSQPSPNGYFNFKSPINSIQPNQWYSVVYEFSNSTAKCYINGNLVGTFTSPYSSFNWSYLQQGNSTSTTYFGVTHPVSPGLTNYFDGIIDDVGFWERSLTSSEIQSLSIVGSPTLTWSTGETGDSIWVKPTATTTYTLTQSLGGATCTDSIAITVNSILINSSNVQLCLGESTILNASNTGSGQGSFLWSTGDTTASITVAPTSTTSYWVTNATGCSDTVQVEVNTTNFNVLPDSIISCSTDSILFQFSGFDSYLWSDGSSDSVKYLSNNAQGFHWVELAEGFCSSRDTTYMSLGNVKVDIDVAQEITCNGFYDGELYVDVSGAQGAYSVSWSNQQTSDTISNLPVGTYWVQIIDSLGCIGTDTILLEEPTALSVDVVLDSINGFNLACHGDSTGYGYMVPSGGKSPYSYNWNVIPTVFDSTINQLSQGNSQWAMAIDANGCFATDTFNVLAPSTFSANALMLDSVTCYGGSDGSAYALTFGGTGASSFQWSNTASSDTVSGLVQGDLYLTATDSSGCTAMDTVQIFEATEILTTTAVLTNHNGFALPCAGDTTGQGVVSVTGGSGGYSYSWSTGSNSDTINNVSAGQYLVTVTDNKGCFKVDTLTLIEPDTLNVSITSDTNIFGNHVDCYLGQTAEIYSAVNGGSGAIQYSWSTSTPNSNDTLSNVGAGTYWLNIVDVNGCVSSDTIDLYEPSQLNVITTVLSNYNGFDISCNGLADGEISVNASGSNGGYSYAWSTGDTTTLVDSLSANTYFVIVTDSLGCQSQELITLNQPTSLALSMSKSNFNGYDVSCNGSLDGFAHGLISGGVPGYSYAWSSISSSDSLTNIGVGSYALVVTDSNGCHISDSITLIEPDSLSIALSSTTNFNGYNVSCFGSSDGALASTITGGVPSYTFSWTLNGQSTGSQNVLSGQPSGWHQLNVQDLNGCLTQDSIYLSQPDSLVTSSVITSDYNGVAISCFDSSDGSAAVQVFGGVQPYQYTWNAGTPTVDSTQSNLFAGLNIVLITDANNCVVTDSVSLVGPDSLNYTSSISDILCHGDASGSVKIIPSGGVPLHTVQWAYQGLLADSITNIPQGIYSFVITDFNGCQLEDSVEVVQAQEIVSVLDTVPPSCYQIEDGSIALSTNGGFAPYSYVVNDSTVTLPLENIGVGQYWIEITDSVGCSISLEVFMDPENEQCFNIPNLFSPNGDNYNDSWTIRVPKDYTYEVFIYNPLGQIIYQGTDSDPYWDGTGPNGPVVNGDYYYAMVINSTEKIYGYVTVIR